MTSLQVRTHPAQDDCGADVLLDWFEDKNKPASTIRYQERFLKGLAPTLVAQDLLRIGGAVYCTDKVVKREDTYDGWTRELSLTVPVSDPRRWDGARDELVKALNFLSGDRWNLTFTTDTVERPETEPLLTGDDAVSLFSGGLDSLAGVIDILEGGHRLLLVGHHDSGLTDSKQKELYGELRTHYGADRVQLRRLYLRPAPRTSAQTRPLPAGGGENTTRSRSFLFFAAGLVVADAVAPTTPLYIPENGFIGINVPLTPARAGSLSTRTTHPLYMDRMRRVLDSLGLAHPLENPYRLLTKGELLDRSANKKLLMQLAPRSVSCSHPEAPRWAKRPQGNCGYCYPCIIRRASMHHVGRDQLKGHYAWDALTESELLNTRRKRGLSLYALTASLNEPERMEDILKNGRIPNGEAPAFFEMYCRGRAELRDWLKGAGPDLARRLR